MAKRKLTIQWDSTSSCNLRCSHCYHNREREHSDMSIQKVRKMVDDLYSTASRWGLRPRLNISGGEPIMRDNLMDILEYTSEKSIETRLLTNGTLIDSNIAEKIHSRGVDILQISLDGSKKTHNEIRGRDYAFDRALRGVRKSREEGIFVTVSMTGMKSNLDEIEKVVSISEENGANYFGVQTYVPTGRDDPELLNNKEMFELYNNLREYQKRHPDIEILETEVLWQLMRDERTPAMENAVKEGKFLEGCGAGYSGISVLSDGTVYPCRRMPIKIGNIEEGLVSLIARNGFMKRLRELENNCEEGCDHISYCRGCRAVAYAVTGDPLAKDPLCFKDYINDDES